MANNADAINVAVDKERYNKNNDGMYYTPYRHRKGMTLYLRLNIKINNEDSRNRSPMTMVINVAQKRIDEYPKYTFEEFVSNNASECVKSGEFEITRGAYEKFLAKHKYYYGIYQKAKVNECRGYFEIDRAGIKKEAAKISKPVHDVADMAEKLALDGLLTAVEAQDLYQSMYRIKQVLDAYVMPDVLFQNMLFYDKKLTDKIKTYNHLSNFKISSKANADRFVKHMSKIDGFETGNRVKKLSTERKVLESLCSTL
ncbi:hypothetical protein VB583_01265 [Vibrio parahaemolyticus]|uniref:hypothetical protein n=1 Tax=Vibrio parahaemolyticus TaxID=670 RepID=UPI00186A9C98|nr:hypothetical protein [Vibrio parahaemolyticus]MBE4432220.1 hypothetical protein [Vibrio parahaemolyticus]MEA5335089.1 hypothetical protein [Vibrio parahaemolyticus]